LHFVDRLFSLHWEESIWRGKTAPSLAPACPASQKKRWGLLGIAAKGKKIRLHQQFFIGSGVDRERISMGELGEKISIATPGPVCRLEASGRGGFGSKILKGQEDLGRIAGRRGVEKTASVRARGKASGARPWGGNQGILSQSHQGKRPGQRV